MRSSSGEHFIALDHVRAAAAFMVFSWHFVHFASVPFAYTPVFFPLALLDEGHTGVALFMTLSGYLFAKLLDGKTIRYRSFLRNRALRLLPLLAVVVLMVGVQAVMHGGNLPFYVSMIAAGALLPTLPNGGWSITAEFHYYLMLPVFLWLLRKSRWLPLLIVVVAIVIRAGIFHARGEVQTLAYWTIVGRIDQFTLGMIAFHFRSVVAGRHLVGGGALLLFAFFYWLFDLAGGFYQLPSYPSPSPLWIAMPTLEGAAYGAGIAWYESSFKPAGTGFSGFLGRMGCYSYSIYLLHFFVVEDAARFIHSRVMDLSNFYVACAWAAVAFAAMYPVAWLSFRFIEEPFLRRRRPYAVAAGV